MATASGMSRYRNNFSFPYLRSEGRKWGVTLRYTFEAMPMRRRGFIALRERYLKKRILRQRAAASTSGRMRKKDADVARAGAGPVRPLRAGLLLLEEQGLKVCVVEGRDRVGGRMFTLDQLPLASQRAAVVCWPARYARALDLATRLNVALAPARLRTEPVAGEAGQYPRADNPSRRLGIVES
ncbi:MAG: hypothetical protein R3E75_04955 [Steroidobacteraceae bacterium]